MNLDLNQISGDFALTYERGEKNVKLHDIMQNSLTNKTSIDNQNDS